MDYIKDLLPEKLVRPSMKAAGVAVAGGLTTYCVIKVCRRIGRGQSKGHIKIPLPKGRIPYFGHIFAFKDEFAVQLKNWQEELGPAMYVDIGVERWLLISDPYLAHDLLSVNGSIASNRPYRTFTDEYYAKNRGVSFCSPSAQWNKTRGAMVRCFGPKSNLELRKVIDHETSALVDSITAITERDGQVEVLKPLELAIMNLLLTITVGKRATSINDPLFKSLRDVPEKGSVHASPMKDMKTFLPLFSILDYIFHRPNMRQFMQEIFVPTYGRIVKDALESKANCLVKELSKLDHMDEGAMSLAVADAVAGANDSIARSLLWIIVILCRHKDTQQMLQKEIDEFIKIHKRIPTFDDRSLLPHLVSAQKECMRYRSVSIFGSPHETTQDVLCRGYYIPKGTVVLTNMQAMHMNPDAYSEPEKFIPDRFLNSSKTIADLTRSAIQERDIYVFGWGRRVCPGVYMAEVQIFTALIHLLAKCNIEPPLDQDQKPVYPNLDKVIDDGMIVWPKDTIVRIHKRGDALI